MISDTKFNVTKFKVFTPIVSLSRDKCSHLIVKKNIQTSHKRCIYMSALGSLHL